MPTLTPSDLRAALDRDLPGAAEPPPPPPAEPVTPPAKGEKAPVNLLATNDVVVYSDHLPDAARYLRDTLGYTLLSNLTAVDYLKDDMIEVVYHFLHLDGGPPAVLKTRLPRSNPQIASLTPWWPGAGLQEREAYDLFGVVFTGHPYLQRIYMWDEFEGFPMRKDFPKQGDKYFGE